MTSSRQRSLSESSNDGILENINDDTFDKLLPAIAICGAFSLIGTIGNSLSVFVFATRMKSNFQNNLFIYLCVVNVMACAVCIPGDIVDLRFTYMYPSLVACKVTRFFNMFTMAGSVLTLGTLSVYRLRAASTARMNPSSQGSSLRGIFALVLGSVGIAWLGPVIYGIHTSPTRVKDVIGRDCSIDDDIANTPWQLGFYLFLGVGFFTLILTVAISYYKIWRIVKISRMTVAAHTTIKATSPVATPTITGRGIVKTLTSPGGVSKLPSTLAMPVGGAEDGCMNDSMRYDSTVPTITATDLRNPASSSNDVSLLTNEQHSKSTRMETSEYLVLFPENNETFSTNTKDQDSDLHLLADVNDNGNMKEIGEVARSFRPFRSFNNKIGGSLKVNDWKTHHSGSSGKNEFLKDRLEIEDEIPKRSFSVREDRKVYVIDSGDKAEKRNNSESVIPFKDDVLSPGSELSEDSVASRIIRELDLIGLIDNTSPEWLKPKPKRSSGSSQGLVKDLVTPQPLNSSTQQLIPDASNVTPTFTQPDLENLSSAQRPLDAPTFQNSVDSCEVDNNETTATISDRITLSKKTNKIKPLKPSDSRLTSVKSNVRIKNSKTALEIAITRTAFLLTFTFIVSYLPFFIASIPRLIDPDFDYSEDAAKLNLINMAYRLYFVNPTISPFIFWASNLDFRRKFKSLCS